MPTVPIIGRKGRDVVTELTEFPQMNPGAPSPLLLADGHRLALVYYLNRPPPQPEGGIGYTTVGAIDSRTSIEPVIFVKFEFVEQFRFGYPNDDALAGHKLYKHGLEHYSVSEINDQS